MYIITWEQRAKVMLSSLDDEKYQNQAKGCNGVKKSIILKVISIVFALITILAIACAITGTGSGFLDLSNIARAVCIGVAIICGILAFIAWKCSKSKA